MQPVPAPLEVRQQKHLHGSLNGTRKTKEELKRRWQSNVEKNSKVTLPKCKSFPQYYETAYSKHGSIPGWSYPPPETQVSLLGDTRCPVSEGKYGLAQEEEPHFRATYSDLGKTYGESEFEGPEPRRGGTGAPRRVGKRPIIQTVVRGSTKNFETPTRGNPVSHHTISLPVFPDVPDVADWRPGVGPPINPDPAKEAANFRSTYSTHGEGFQPKSKGMPSKHHHHSVVGEKVSDADKSHGGRQKWDVLLCNPPGVGDPVNPDPAKEGINFSSTYADLGHWTDAANRKKTKTENWPACRRP